MHGIIGKQARSLAIRLYPYQRTALKRITAQLEAAGRAFLIAPTASGKTVMFGFFIKAQPLGIRALVLEETVDLVVQTAAKLTDILPDRAVATVCATLSRKQSYPMQGSPFSGTAPASADVVVGTIDTVAGVLDDLGSFDILIIDEADRSAADTYQAIVAKLTSANPGMPVLGVSAVVERSDRRGHEVIFGTEAPIVILIEDLWRDGYLVPLLDPKHLPLDVIKGHRFAQTGDDDADDTDLSKALNVQIAHDEVIRNWVRYGQGRLTIAHCASIEHAKGLAEAFTGCGIDAATVSCKTPIKKRIELLNSFAKGDGPKVICSPALLLRGYDPPPCSCVMLLRAFWHKSTLIQAVGRALRRADERFKKQDCLVLDFVAAVERHGGKNAFMAGTDMTDRRRPSADTAGGVVPNLSIPTIFDYGEADLEDFVLGFQFTASLRKAVAGTEPEPEPLIIDGKRVGRSRREARAKGLLSYFTGKPCARGHVSNRSVYTGCEECNKERLASYKTQARDNKAICAHCKTEFAISYDQNIFTKADPDRPVYCSLSCASLFGREKNRIAAVFRECPGCKNTYELSVSKRSKLNRTGRVSYCSQGCYDKNRGEARRKPAAYHPCARCSSPIQLTTNKRQTLKRGGKIYCTKACQFERASNRATPSTTQTNTGSQVSNPGLKAEVSFAQNG